MAQYINKNLSSLVGTGSEATPQFPAWRAHNIRQISRELAGIRGCAPAVQMHDTAFDNQNPSDTNSLNSPDDRIFHVHAYTPIYFWGQEMHIGGNTVRDNGFDALNIYFRSFGQGDSDWVLVKGCGEYGFDGVNGSNVSSGGSPVFAPNGNLCYLDSRLPYYINHNETFLDSSGNPISNNHTSSGVKLGAAYYPRATCNTGDTCGPSDRSSKYKHFPYISEEFVCGNFLINGSYGPGTTSNDSRSANKSIYDVYSKSHVRCFFFHREGEYKFEIDETLSHKGKTGVLNDLNRSNKWYTNNDSELPTEANSGGKELYRKRKNEKYKPVDYSSNPGLYLTLPSQIYQSTSVQTYRSRFTRTIIVKAFMPDRDLVTGAKFTGSDDKREDVVTLNPGTVRTNSVVTKAYTHVIGYGAVHEAADPYNTTFIGKPATEVPYSTTDKERFSKFLHRWEGTPRSVLNRRHLLVEGVTIKGNPRNRDNGGHNFRWYIDTSDFNSQIVDFRGCTFRDCVFEDININGAGRDTIFGGCKFIGCKFIRSVVNLIGDSNLFIHCTFEGRAKEAYDSLYTGGNSSAYISCHFENLTRLFFVGTQDYPCTDNLWLRNTFDCVLFNSAGSETFLVENYDLNSSTFSSNCPAGGCPPRAYPAGGSWLAKQQNREFSRNMILCNRFYDTSVLQISTYNGFSRANFYFQNTTDGPTQIYTRINTGGSYYEVHTHNHYNRFRLQLGSNTHHMRFVENIFSEPHMHNTSSSSLQQSSVDYKTSICSISNSYETTQDLGQTWACPYALHSTGNKLIHNIFHNWGGYINNFVGSNCSPFLNFYPIEGCLNCHLGRTGTEGGSSRLYIGGFNEDLYNEMLDWVDKFSNGDGKLLNVAYKNTFHIPTSYSTDNTATATTIGFPWVGDTDCECNQDAQKAKSYNCNAIFIGSGITYPRIDQNSNGNYARVSPLANSTNYNSGFLFDWINSDIRTSPLKLDTYLSAPNNADYPNSNIVSHTFSSGSLPAGYNGFAPVINTNN